MPWNGPMTPGELLEHFHGQVRLRDRDAAPGFVVDRDGPVHRTYPPDAAEHGAMVECPGGLGDDPEVVLLGNCADLVHDVELPAGTRLREIVADEDWDRVRVSVDQVWGEDTSWVNDALRAEQRRDPDLLTAVVVEDAVTLEVLSYGVLRVQPETDFCGMWGGSTLAQWRGRGLYRALTSYRARLALEHGYRYARVDTSPDSRPILVGLGMQAVADTRPYLFDPS